MSDHKLQKIPTQWLDEHDDKAAENGGGDLHGDSKAQGRTSQEFEVIIGTLSKQSSAGPESEGHEGYKVSMISGKKSGERPQDTDRNQYRLSWCRNSLTLTSFDIGSSRFIRKQTLLCVRVGGLAVLGIFAGMWLSERRSTHIQSLLMELFVWDHGLFLLVQPFLVAGSLMAIYLSGDNQAEECNKPSCCWTAVAVSSHVVKTFSVTEVIRLLTLNVAHSLQPPYGELGTKAVFSLGSVFASQRYVLVAVSAIEIIFCATPQHVICIAVVALISACWEALVFVIRGPKPLTERLIVLFGSTGVAAATSAVIVLLSGYLARVQAHLTSESEGNAAASSDAL